MYVAPSFRFIDLTGQIGGGLLDLDEISEALPAGDRSPALATRECRAFYRAVNAACAWTIGPQTLLRQKISKVAAPLFVSITEFPLQDVRDLSGEALVEHWGSLGTWSESTRLGVNSHLGEFRKTTVRTTSSTCHCEAGLAASIFLPQKDLSSEDDTSPDLLKTPFTIGAAKKCCPVCSLLIDVLRTRHQVELYISGAHGRFQPWVPPKWLPDNVVQELEKRLVNIVGNMVFDHDPLHGGRASSRDEDSDPETMTFFI
ncbi:hypothetical protein C8R45DRAFT_483972 [Mycena sanguinolenta]|nr:hypothetical protein C8R45DRAFT_483972 [Mycena sanguinolenta]